MIDEYWTWIFYGYHSDELKPKSAKLVVVMCDECCQYRLLKMQNYRDLCNLCVHKTEDYRRNQSKSHKKENLSEDTLEKMRNSAKNRPPINDETSRKLSDARRRENLSEDTLEKMRNSGKRENLSEETLEKMRESSGKRKHTEDSKIKIGDAQRGEKNHNWKGGISSERDKLHNSQELKQWRIAVFERDGYMCQECLEHGVVLNAHHILPYRDWKEPRFSLNIKNGITLCEDCHRETYGKEYEFFNKYFDIANIKVRN